MSKKLPGIMLFLLGSFAFVGLCLLGKEGDMRKGGTKRGGTSCRELPEDQVNTLLCYIPGTRWRTGDGGRRVDRKGLDSGRDRTAGFLILIKKGFLF